MKQKTFFLFFLCVISFVNIQAQNARTILDRTTATLKKSGGFQAKFQTTTYKGDQPSSTIDGEVSIEGNRFKLHSSSITSWYNGETLWTLIAGSNEVNISTPTETERQTLNPYALINLYKKGYNSYVRQTTYQGKSCYEVQLRGHDQKKNPQEVRLIIDTSTYLPLSIRMKHQQGDWIRIRISNIRFNQKFTNETFTFNTKDYPGIEVIDLR